MRWILGAALLAACRGEIDAPVSMPVPGREDVHLTEFHAHVSGGTSDEVQLPLRADVGGALIEVEGPVGEFRLARMVSPSGEEIAESGHFVTRDAREVDGLVDWLFPNSPLLRVESGAYRVNFAALEGGQGVGDEDITVRLYTRGRVGLAGQIRLDVFVVGDALGTVNVERAVDHLVGVISKVYAQVNISMADYSINRLNLPSSTLSLDFSKPGSAIDVVAMARKLARPGALHLVLGSKIADGDNGTIGYSLGLPGPFDPERPNAAVLIATGSTDGALDLPALGITCAHEIGHYLGLYHTSESSRQDFDPLPDTPECRGTGACPDADNIMFYTGGSSRMIFSPQQGAVLKSHPICEPAEPPVPPSCSPACSGEQACVIVAGDPACKQTCELHTTLCATGRCQLSDDGKLVCL